MAHSQNSLGVCRMAHSQNSLGALVVSQEDRRRLAAIEAEVRDEDLKVPCSSCSASATR